MALNRSNAPSFRDCISTSEQPAFSIGHGGICCDLFTNIPVAEGTLEVRHPLSYSDVRNISSQHLWTLHERLRDSIQKQYTADSAFEHSLSGANIVARHDSLTLIDMLLHERSRSRKLEPPANADFGKKADQSSNPSVKDSEFESGLPHGRDNAASVTLSDVFDSVDYTRRKDAHLRQLQNRQDADQEADRDTSSDEDASPDDRLKKLYQREEGRLDKLIRDKRSGISPQHVIINESSDKGRNIFAALRKTSKTAPGSERTPKPEPSSDVADPYMMSGGQDSDSKTYLPDQRSEESGLLYGEDGKALFDPRKHGWRVENGRKPQIVLKGDVLEESSKEDKAARAPLDTKTDAQVELDVLQKLAAADTDEAATPKPSGLYEFVSGMFGREKRTRSTSPDDESSRSRKSRHLIKRKPSRFEEILSNMASIRAGDEDTLKKESSGSSSNTGKASSQGVDQPLKSFGDVTYFTRKQAKQRGRDSKDKNGADEPKRSRERSRLAFWRRRSLPAEIDHDSSRTNTPVCDPQAYREPSEDAIEAVAMDGIQESGNDGDAESEANNTRGRKWFSKRKNSSRLLLRNQQAPSKARKESEQAYSINATEPLPNLSSDIDQYYRMGEGLGSDDMTYTKGL